jgi:hypothetical protein
MSVDLILGDVFVLQSHSNSGCLNRALTHERAPRELCGNVSFLFFLNSYPLDVLQRAFCVELKAAQFNLAVEHC